MMVRDRCRCLAILWAALASLVCCLFLGSNRMMESRAFVASELRPAPAPAAPDHSRGLERRDPSGTPSWITRIEARIPAPGQPPVLGIERMHLPEPPPCRRRVILRSCSDLPLRL